MGDRYQSSPPLEGKGDLVPQVEREGNSEDVEYPPAWFIPHYVFEHEVSPFCGYGLTVFCRCFSR